MSEHHGTCLCGAVTWMFSGEPDFASHCHCLMCRKAHGAAFGTYYFVPADRFLWTGSQSSITGYRSSPGVTRAFCRTCGSLVPALGPDGKSVDVPAGSHDRGPAVSCHIFVDHKAPWHEITDDLPRHGDYPSGVSGSVIPDKPLPPKPDGVVARGSCLCGIVEFEITEPFRAVHNCHCSRCRRARSAAFTTNGFTSSKGIRFLQGEGHVKLYRLSDARYFSHAFCDTCGSGLPRIDTGRKLASIPLGALDDDPGQGPRDHIFVDDRADWYEIGGELPRFPQAPG